MASLNLHSPPSLSCSLEPSLPPKIQFSSPSFPAFKKALWVIGSTSLKAQAGGGGVVGLTENAVKHLKSMTLERKEDVRVRIGVKQGGCSGLSYTMEFEGKESSRRGDCVIEYDGFAIVCDEESLASLGGVQLDYNVDTPFGRGFRFHNQNATPKCGCGRSFCCRDVNVASLHT